MNKFHRYSLLNSLDSPTIDLPLSSPLPSTLCSTFPIRIFTVQTQYFFNIVFFKKILFWARDLTQYNVYTHILYSICLTWVRRRTQSLKPSPHYAFVYVYVQYITFHSEGLDSFLSGLFLVIEIAVIKTSVLRWLRLEDRFSVVNLMGTLGLCTLCVANGVKKKLQAVLQLLWRRGRSHASYLGPALPRMWQTARHLLELKLKCFAVAAMLQQWGEVRSTLVKSPTAPR